ncbi:putative tRNA (cytidine(34)-2'-O)-methyltransferase [Tanacetum coccineum]|uniref:tRNA (Cytidine(34)-2'-O)-methyltransferase n=1 Tax=Tanacetum coccineum TaxID=301880 RepID=A0ABQ5IBY7_9ASTR
MHTDTAQIPGNTGCIARSCAASGVGLHLVEPLGFEVDDTKLKRAGLDYWPFTLDHHVRYVVVKVHNSWTDFREYFKQQNGEKRLLAFTKRGTNIHSKVEDTSKKKVGTTSTPQFQCPTLKPSNYSLWAIRMQLSLAKQTVYWEMKYPMKNPSRQQKSKTAIAFLIKGLTRRANASISQNTQTQKAYGDALKTRHIGEERVQQVRLQTLKSEFEMLHMKEDETIDPSPQKLKILSKHKQLSRIQWTEETLVVNY